LLDDLKSASFPSQLFRHNVDSTPNHREPLYRYLENRRLRPDCLTSIIFSPPRTFLPHAELPEAADQDIISVLQSLLDELENRLNQGSRFMLGEGDKEPVEPLTGVQFALPPMSLNLGSPSHLHDDLPLRFEGIYKSFMRHVPSS